MISKADRAAARKKVAFLEIIACESRYLIIAIIHSKKKLTVQNIADGLGMNHSAVSHQLSILSKAGILTSKKEGREAFYRLTTTPQALATLKIIKT